MLSDLYTSASRSKSFSCSCRRPFQYGRYCFPVHKLRQFTQLDLHREEMPCQYRLLYDLFMNTGLRLKEVYLLEEDCIEESRYPNVCQLKYIPHKTLSARHRRGAGDYHRIMIPKDMVLHHFSALLQGLKPVS